MTFKRHNTVKSLIQFNKNFSNNFLKPHDALGKYNYLILAKVLFFFSDYDLLAQQNQFLYYNKHFTNIQKTG